MRFQLDRGPVDDPETQEGSLPASGPVSVYRLSATHNFYALICILITVLLLPAQTQAQDWWNADYNYRRQLTVNTGTLSPAGGYNGYTVRIANFNSADLVSSGKLQSDGDDLRVVYWDGSSWTDLDRHIISSNSTTTDIRFRLQADVSASSSTDAYYLYYGNSTASSGPANLSNVYRWFDSGTSNNLSSYTLGRGDAWMGSGGTNSFTWNSGGYYTYDTGDNYTNSMRIPNSALSERDAYIEAEFYHTGAYPNDMTSGLTLRYIASSNYGTRNENAGHYYASNRAWSSFRNRRYSYDGDILENRRGRRAIDGSRPSYKVQGNQWRKQALAMWDVNSTHGKFWDTNTASDLGPMGWPSANPITAGNDRSDYEGSGEAGFIVSQDKARVRNILVRRYTEPEPSLDLGNEAAKVTAGGGGGGQKWNVCSDGDFTSLQSAINSSSVSDGDTLLVCGGTYNENVNLTKSLVIIGEDSSTVIVDAASNNSPVFTINAHSVELAGMTIKGSGSDEAIYFRTTSRNGAAIIRNNIIKDNDQGIDMSNVRGDVKILNNVIGDHRDYAIRLMGRNGNPGRAIIKDNTIELGPITRDYEHGVYVEKFPSVKVINNSINLSQSRAKLFYFRYGDSLVVDSNRTTSDVKYSIYVSYFYKSITITDNSLPHSDLGFYQTPGNNTVNITMDNNDFSQAHQRGLYVNKADSLTVTNNRFERAAGESQSENSVYIRYNSHLNFSRNSFGPNNNRRYGLYARDGKSILVSNNTQYGKSGRAIYLRNIREKATIQYNSADSSSYGFIQQGSYAETDFTIDNNDFSDCTVYGIYMTRGDTVSITSNQVAAPAGGSQSGRSIYMQRSNHLTVTGNTAGTNRSNREAIYVRYGKSATISNNTINPGSYMGIYVLYFTDDITISGNQAPGSIQYGCRIYNSARSSSVKIDQNDFSGSLTYGVYVYKADSLVVTNTSAQAPTGGSQTRQSIYSAYVNSYVEVSNSTVGTHSTTGGDYAVYVYNTRKVVLKNNTIEGPNDIVFYVSDDRNNPRLTRLDVLGNYATNFRYGLLNNRGRSDRKVYVKQNLFARGTQRGIHVEYGDSLVCVNNTLTKNNIGLYFRNIKTRMKHNIITDNTYGIYRRGSYGYTLSYNDVWDNITKDYYNLSAGSTDISEDPKYVDPTNGDFHLQSLAGSYHGGAWTADANHSPAIDAGDPNAGYGNEPPPNGERVNLGAYGNTSQASKSGALTETKNFAGFPRKKWVMLGVPLTPDDPDAQAVLGDDFNGQTPNGSNWRVVRWITTDEGYAFYGEDGDGPLALPGKEPPDFVPGLAFWVIQDVLETATVDVTGVAHEPGTTVRVALENPSGAGKSGINMVANPFETAVDWSTVQISDGIETKSILAAGAAGWLSAQAYPWNWETSEYEIVSPDEASSSDTISVWEGFWMNQIDTLRNLVVIFPYPSTPKLRPAQLPFVDRFGKSLKQRRGQIRELFIDWAMDLYLVTEDGQYRDLNNRIGVSESTTDGMDGLDALFFVPNATEFGALYFPHEDWSPSVKLDYDYRSNEWNEQLWAFQVWDNNVSGNWALRWPNISNVPGNIKLSLTGLDTNNVIISDLRTEPEYSLSLNSGSKRDYILKAVAIEDTLAPTMLVGFVQNPVLEDYVDLYVYPSEPVNDVLVIVNDEFLFPEFNVSNYNMYRASFKITTPGIHTIITAVEDLAGYSGEDTLVVNFQTILAGRVISPDGIVELGPFSESVNTIGQYAGLGYSIGRNELPLPAGSIGKVYTIYVPGLVPEDPVRILFDLRQLGIVRSQYSNIALLQETTSGWKPVPARIHPQLGHLEAELPRDGRIILSRSSGENTEILPEKTRLMANYPNPFNATTVIPYQIAKETRVKISVFDLLGREVTVLRNGRQAPGSYTVSWRSVDKFGRPVASGLYLVRFEADNIRKTRKLTLIR